MRRTRTKKKGMRRMRTRKTQKSQVLTRMVKQRRQSGSFLLEKSLCLCGNDYSCGYMH